MRIGLASKVAATNKANAYANQLRPQILEALAPFVGKDATKVNHTLFAKVAQSLPTFVNQNDLMVYNSSTKYSLKWTVKASVEFKEGSSSFTVYHEAVIYAADLTNHRIEKLYSDELLRADYTVDEILAKQAEYKLHHDAAEKIKSSLYPFPVHNY